MLPGNKQVKNELFEMATKSIQLEKKFPHAILIAGPSDTGKFTTLKKIAEILLEDTIHVKNLSHPSLVVVNKLWIDNVNTDEEVLGNCSNFNQIHRKKAKKKTDTIGIDDISEFTKNLYSTSDYKYKICIIKDIHRMTKEASNTFLKILEEPPDKTIFLLTTSKISSVLTTILSRVQKRSFSLVKEEYLGKMLEKYELNENTKKMMIMLAQGRPIRLQKFLENTEEFHRQKEILEHIVELKNYNILSKMILAESWAKLDENELKENLNILLNFLRNNFRENIKNSSKESLGKILLNISCTLELNKNLVTNANRRLLLENFLINLN